MQSYWRMCSKLDLRPSNLQLMPGNFQIQYSYLLNRSSGSAILFTNKCIRRRNIAFLQACQLQIWQPSIANENTRYIIIALEWGLSSLSAILQLHLVYHETYTNWGRKPWTDIMHWTVKLTVLGRYLETLTIKDEESSHISVVRLEVRSQWPL